MSRILNKLKEISSKIPSEKINTKLLTQADRALKFLSSRIPHQYLNEIAKVKNAKTKDIIAVLMIVVAIGLVFLSSYFKKGADGKWAFQTAQKSELEKQENPALKASTLYQAAIEHFKQGQFETAVTELEQVVAQMPNDAAVQISLGVVLGTLGKMEQAKASLNRALELSPENAAAYNALGNYYIKERDWDSAIDAFKKGLSFKKDFKEIHLNLGRVYEMFEDWASAVGHYEEFLRNPTSDPVLSNLIKVRMRKLQTLIRIKRSQEESV